MTSSDKPRLSMADHYDAEVRRLYQRFLAATGVVPTDQVLDVGCGAGQSTRDAARAASSGGVLGVDVSERMIERARRLTAEAGLTNITYELADAQVHQFPPAGYDVVISRFGTMFFADPVAAFTNIARATRPGARLVMLVWQGHDRNEWATAIHRSLTAGTAKPAQLPGSPDPFSLADPSDTERILATAGFVEVGFTEVHEPVYYGADAAVAYDLVLSLQSTSDLLAELRPAEADHAVTRLRAMLAGRADHDGVWFDSRAWIVSATRSSGRRPVRAD